ncbi:uncharacterized protein LOC135954447 [Calliphora vicina]|uniref:uncharacterized protein LOC135954447 n=1 Tax=Calliphora vicina TaxID=7373 RepID=UPI00325AC498
MWWLKTLLLSLVVSTASAATTSIPTDVSAYLQNIGYFNDPANNFTNIVNLINGSLKSLNLSDIEVNIILNRLEDSQPLNTENNIDAKEFETSLTYLFKTILSTNLNVKYILQEMATAANNLTVHEIVYEIIWQELNTDHNKSNPFIYIELYKDLESIMKNFTSDKLIRLRHEIQTSIVQYSAQILQSYFIHNSTIRMLLAELKQLDNLYQTTIPRVFLQLDGIEHEWLITEDLLDFDAQTQEAVYNHITYLEYLKNRNEVTPYRIYENLEMLIARPDFVNISITQRQISSKLLPLSMGNIFAAQKLCLRNITTNYYLYECPQTYLMCTNFIAKNINPINRKKAAFEIDRLGNDLYTLRSPYWGRYLHLQDTTSKNTPLANNINNSSSNTSISKITKNLYSQTEASSWFIKFHGNYATIQDSTKNVYICGGDSAYWSNMEKYSYTRPSKDFYTKQNECLWLLEDCSDVV